MRMLTIMMLCVFVSSCKTQKYNLQFLDKESEIVLTLTKTLDAKEKCFSFSKEEKDSIQNYNLNQGFLKLYKGNKEIQRFYIIDVFTSGTYEGKILLCDVDGRLKFNEPLCIETE